MSSERRRDERLEVAWTGQMMSEDGVEYACDVIDISEAGALIRADVKTKLDDDFFLEIEGLGEFAGRVKWVGEKAVGLMLLAGPSIELKKFAEGAGAEVSTKPAAPTDFSS